MRADSVEAVAPAAAVLPVVAVVLMAALLMPTALAETGLAQEDVRESRTRLDLTVADFTGAVSPQGTFRLRVRVTNRTRRTLDDLRVVASIHRRAFHRLDYARAVDDGRVGDLWSSLSTDLAPLRGRRVATVELRKTAEELGWGGADDKQGVYPLVIRLQRGDDTVETIRTAVVVVASEVAQPLRGALVVPVEAPPALREGGAMEPGGLLRDLSPQGRLAALLRDLGRRPDVPVTFALDARLLDEATDLGDGYTAQRAGEPVERDANSSLARAARGFLTQLRRTLAQPQVESVALPYGPGDLAALARGGMASEAGRLVIEGRVGVERHTGTRPAPAVLLPGDGLSPAALTEAVTTGVDTVIVEQDFLDGTESGSTSPAPVHELRSRAGTTVTAAMPDPWLADLLADEAALRRLDPPVAVQRVIAETAAVYFERPFARDARGLLLVPPLHWRPPAEFAGGLAGGLRAAPWIQPVTLTTLLREVDPPHGTPVRLAYPDEARERELPLSYVRELRDARRALGSLAGVLAADTSTPGRFDRALLTAASLWYREDPEDGLPLIRDVTRTVDELYEAVRVAESPTVVLSGAQGQIPVTVENNAPIALRLTVRMQTQRFAFDGGPMRTVTVPSGGTQTIAFRGRLRSAGGTFPVRVVVADVDGQLQLASGTLVVRSTAVSGAALAVVVGAGVFLLVWWLRSATRRRAAKRADARAHASDAA